MKLQLSFALAAMSIAASSMAANNGMGVDSASLEFATGNKTKMLRVGVQSDWDVKWFAGSGKHLGGYWDLSLAQWRGNQYQDVAGSTQDLVDIGITPVFRWQNDNKRGLYFEGGIGFHRLSKLYDNDGRKLSTRFQFGDHIGVGYVFDNNWELAGKIQHFSNGGYKKPNHGVNFIEVKAAYHF